MLNFMCFIRINSWKTKNKLWNR